MAIISLKDRLHITAPVGQNMIRPDLSCETTQDNRRQRFHDSSFLFLFFCFAARNLLIVAKKKKKISLRPPGHPATLTDAASCPSDSVVHSSISCTRCLGVSVSSFCHWEFLTCSLRLRHPLIARFAPLIYPAQGFSRRLIRVTEKAVNSSLRFTIFFPVGCIYFCLKIPLTSPLLSAGRLGKEGWFVFSFFFKKKEDIFSHFAELSPLHVDTPVWEAVGAAV